MISALVYLQFYQIRNRLATRLRRLKRPKYLVGAVFGAIYMVVYFGWLISAQSHPQGAPTGPLSITDPQASENFGALLFLGAVLLLGWVLPNERAVLAFSEAEINFLFPAPVTRRQLIQYKLVRAQVSIFFSVIFLTLIWGRWRYGGHVLVSALGWWVILSTLNLHTIAASFARSMLLDRGITNLRRRIIILTGLAVVIGAAFAWSHSQWPPFPDNAGPDEFLGWFKQVLSVGVTPYVLYPFRLVVRPYFAHDTLTFLHALAPALGVLALHYIVVVRADVAFEEASVEFSQKLATRMAAVADRRVRGAPPKKARPAPFTLNPVGWPPLAFLWKNLIQSGNYASRSFVFRVGLIMLVWALVAQPWHSSAPVTTFAGVACLFLIVFSVLTGHNLLRIDLRSDLVMAEQLLSYPLSGSQIVMGELLAPVVLLAGFQWLCIIGALLFLHFPHEHANWGLRGAIAVSFAIFFPAMDFIMVIIANAIAIMFPSWVRFDRNTPRGVENIGLGIVVALAQLLVLFVVLLPASFGAFIVWFISGLVIPGSFALCLAALTGASVLVAEGLWAVSLLGKAFERFDLTAETTN